MLVYEDGAITEGNSVLYATSDLLGLSISACMRLAQIHNENYGIDWEGAEKILIAEGFDTGGNETQNQISVPIALTAAAEATAYGIKQLGERITKLEVMVFESDKPIPVTAEMNYGDARARKQEWIIQRLNDECFPLAHLTALEKIVGLFNSSPMAEAEIFEFAAKLYQKHAL